VRKEERSKRGRRRGLLFQKERGFWGGRMKGRKGGKEVSPYLLSLVK